MDTCRIELLGGLRVVQGSFLGTRFRTQKTAQLLAYLAYFRKRPHPRELLMEMLWPECEPEAGRHSLSVALSALRAQLEPAGAEADGTVFVVDRYTVGIDPLQVSTDVADFEAALKAAAQTKDDRERSVHRSAAVELYTGELLPGCYEEWIFPEQQRLNELFLQTLRELTLTWEQSGDFGRALDYALRSVRADHLSEQAHQEVMRLYIAAGRPEAALRQYRELERTLQQEMEATPDRHTRALLGKLGVTTTKPRESVPGGPLAPKSAAASTVDAPAESPASLPAFPPALLDPAGGAVPIASKFYVTRSTDEEFRAAMARHDMIVLVKGARQVGKTSLLARGLQQAREAGCHVVLTHFQTFNASHLQSAETLLMAIAELIADQLDLDVTPADVWDSRLGPNPNFRRFLRRHVLSKLPNPLVWGLDEVDRIFPCPFGGEIFALFRSWHDERALEPAGPWSRLTLAMAYSTEAQLFITDVHQSPFNVGTQLTLEDFTREQVSDLNTRYGSPLKAEPEVTRYYGLVGGQPYLVCAGLREMVIHGVGIATFEARAASDDWIFAEHLRRMVVLLAKSADLSEVVRGALEGQPCPKRESFYRLRSAGILTGQTPTEADFRCPLYAAYLAQHLLCDTSVTVL